MEELLKLLEKYTEEKGYWELRLNPHKAFYADKPKDYYCPPNEDNDYGYIYENIDWTKPVYELIWYDVSPVGNYDILANSIEDLITNVKRVIKWNHRLEDKPAPDSIKLEEKKPNFYKEQLDILIDTVESLPYYDFVLEKLSKECRLLLDKADQSEEYYRLQVNACRQAVYDAM